MHVYESIGMLSDLGIILFRRMQFTSLNSIITLVPDDVMVSWVQDDDEAVIRGNICGDDLPVALMNYCKDGFELYRCHGGDGIHLERNRDPIEEIQRISPTRIIQC